jgi:asparagine synthase (glutamine-hydrolysing)
MCGIAGLITQNPEEKIGAMLSSIAHRGYDDEGVWTSETIDSENRKVCFGHRRLSIIDTSSAGHQPFFSENRRFVITFNGEIYNYLEIRAELETKGYKFCTDSDTEVLINAFQEWQTGCLNKLNGMFAFAVWDEREKVLTLVRDRAGIKPLYFCRTNAGDFLFASEIKATLAAKLIKAELDNEGLHQFLTFLWTPPPHTLFKNIFQLKPGHFLTWKNGEFVTKEWWDLDFSQEEKSKSEDFWREATLETLDKVVKMEMVADVPLGAFLSGGVDSSSIVALMTKHSKQKVSTYTTGISAEDLSFDIIPDDVEWSRKVARILPVDYHETLQNPDLIELLPKLIWHQDAPVIDMAIPSFLISEQARTTLKVMLSGMGGDEVFAGYPRQMAMQIAGMTDFIPTAMRRPLMKTVDKMLYGGVKGKLTAPLRNAKKFARSAALDFENRYLGFGTYFTDEMKQKIYAPDVRETAKNFDAYRYHREFFAKCRAASPLNRLLYVDFKTFMPCLNLDTTDKTSMAANLEVRVPFLNHELVKLSAKIPAELKIKGLKRKYVLKKAVEKLLPKEIIWRKKAGFSAPVRSWVRGALKPLIDDLLSEETIKKRGLFDAHEVRRVIELNDAGKEDFNLQVFQLLNLEIWCRTFLS